jgi:GTP-binding protein
MALFPDARFLTSAARAPQFLPDDGAEVAFAGRSNAGKSSAINALVGRRDFARTSKTPGRTQLINFFALEESQRLVDLPGYGYAKVSRATRNHWQTLLESYFRKRQSLRGLMVTVDSRRGLLDFDWQMLEWAAALGCASHVLLTKADKLGREESARVLADSRQELGADVGVQMFSATTKLGVDQARQALQALLEGRQTTAISGSG